MAQIVLGSLLLSVIHALIPNHWLPIVTIGKSEKWSRKEMLYVTAVSGSAHTFSTVIIGAFVGLIGYRLSSTEEFATKIAAPLILVMMGMIFIILDYKKVHTHVHVGEPGRRRGRSRNAIILSLSIAMFFSPCLEIDAYFFTAGMYGIYSVMIVSFMYMLVTVSGMLIIVDVARMGVEKIKWRFLEAHEKAVTGSALVFIGLLTYLVNG